MPFQRGNNLWKKAKRIKGEKHHLYGKPLSLEVKMKMSEAHKGKIHSEETRKKISELKKGDKNFWWKGGVTSANRLIRSSAEYKKWRESVFVRDGYTCVFCGKIGGDLEADHIKPFAYFPEDRLNLENGRTLCLPCHRTTFSYRRKLC